MPFAAEAATVSTMSSVDTERLDATAVKAMTRLFGAWKIGVADSARLAGVSERTWTRMKSGSWTGTLGQDQRLRASALVGVYKALHLYFSDALADRWIKLRNQGPLFKGESPADFMIAGGLPAIMRIRDYVDALRGGV
jgi:uncharacterized protein (DUF2384 family)